MTEALSSSVASSELPPIVTPTLEASATETETIVASLPTETVLEAQGQATALATTTRLANLITETAEQTQTASLPISELEGPPSLAPAGPTVPNLESDDDATQFQISHRTSVPDSFAPVLPSNP